MLATEAAPNVAMGGATERTSALFSSSSTCHSCFISVITVLAVVENGVDLTLSSNLIFGGRILHVPGIFSGIFVKRLHSCVIFIPSHPPFTFLLSLVSHFHSFCPILLSSGFLLLGKVISVRGVNTIPFDPFLPFLFLLHVMMHYL